MIGDSREIWSLAGASSWTLRLNNRPGFAPPVLYNTMHGLRRSGRANWWRASDVRKLQTVRACQAALAQVVDVYDAPVANQCLRTREQKSQSYMSAIMRWGFCLLAIKALSVLCVLATACSQPQNSGLSVSMFAIYPVYRMLQQANRVCPHVRSINPNSRPSQDPWIIPHYKLFRGVSSTSGTIYAVLAKAISLQMCRQLQTASEGSHVVRLSEHLDTS